MLRTIPVAVIFMAASYFVCAEESSDRCEQIGALAEVVMENRQNGISLMNSMKAAKDDRLAKDLIMWAYKKPGYSTDQLKKRAVVDFQNEVYMMCLESKEKI
ncbi:hypothetical protein [Azotobacter vinelandii]|uniref:hypothetical protein n=1 Tax=Azotobacter vinelandii TaxID=354 RepID=UPI00092FEBE7|nr:hypothetical protein [Azotobacter vinelandii]